MLEDLNKYNFLEPLKENWKSIYTEYKEIEGKTTSWHEKRMYNSGWEAFGLVHRGDEIRENQELCPFTTNLIKQIPEVYMAGFSILKPKCHIYPHEGYTGEVLRTHLGLDCPGSHAYIKIGNHIQSWKNGEMFVFDDTQIHEAYNNSNKVRVIFILDFQKNQYL